MSTLDEIRELSPYWLSDERYGDCGEPNRSDTHGADYLTAIRDAFVEAVEEGLTGDKLTDRASEAADAAVPIYTYRIWATFTDLCAYQEDPSDMGFEFDANHGMEDAARVCLFMIGERLFNALAEDLTGEDDPDDGSDDE